VKLTVVSHKECWRSPDGDVGYATDGGFAMHMQAIASLFDETVVCVPVVPTRRRLGEVPFRRPENGAGLQIVELPVLRGEGLARKLAYPMWLLRGGRVIDRAVRHADAVHAPIPGDVGTAGMLLAKVHRKPLFVRHCGNWQNRRTTAERLWRWFMERRAGTDDVMVATGEEDAPPSPHHPEITWLFSTSLSERELETLAPPAEPPTTDRLVLSIACRQVEAKGGGVTIEALPEIRRTFPGVHLHVVGDGPQLEIYRRRAQTLDVEQHIEFHGKLDHQGVLDVLQRSHVFVYPTWASEGFPKAVLEALACGLPVVSTAVSAIPALLAGGGGVIVDRPEPDLVAKAVVTVAGDPEHYRSMSASARASAEGYTLEAWATRIGGLLSGWGTLRSDDSARSW